MTNRWRPRWRRRIPRSAFFFQETDVEIPRRPPRCRRSRHLRLRLRRRHHRRHLRHRTKTPSIRFSSYRRDHLATPATSPRAPALLLSSSLASSSLRLLRYTSCSAVTRTRPNGRRSIRPSRGKRRSFLRIIPFPSQGHRLAARHVLPRPARPRPGLKVRRAHPPEYPAGCARRRAKIGPDPRRSLPLSPSPSSSFDLHALVVAK